MKPKSLFLIDVWLSPKQGEQLPALQQLFLKALDAIADFGAVFKGQMQVTTFPLVLDKQVNDSANAIKEILAIQALSSNELSAYKTVINLFPDVGAVTSVSKSSGRGNYQAPMEKFRDREKALKAMFGSSVSNGDLIKCETERHGTKVI